MRILVSVVILAGLLWGGYWFVGARGAEQALRGWLDEHDAGPGLTVRVADLQVAGFPNRFDTTFDQPEIAMAGAGLLWRAPFLQVLALSYKPNHLIAVWPHEQTLRTAGGTTRLASTDMRASLVLEPGSTLALDRLVLIVQAPRLAGEGWSAAADEARLAIRRNTARAGAYDLAVQATAVHLSPELREALGDGDRPDPMGSVRLDTTLDLDGPLDLAALSGRPPVLTGIGLRDLSLRWGDLQVDATGRIEFGATGLTGGDIEVSANDWQPLIAMAAGAGLITPDSARALARAVAAGKGAGVSPSLPLRLRSGALSLGPVALGALPALFQRQ